MIALALLQLAGLVGVPPPHPPRRDRSFRPTLTVLAYPITAHLLLGFPRVGCGAATRVLVVA